MDHQCSKQAAGIIWAEVISAAVSAATRQVLVCLVTVHASALIALQPMVLGSNFVPTRYRCNSPVSRERSAQCLQESCQAGPWHVRCCKCCPSAPAVLACQHFAELLRRSSPSQVSSTCASCWAPPALHASASTSTSIILLSNRCGFH